VTRWAFLLLLTLPLAAAAQEAQTLLHLLDYIGVDYPEAVENGKVKNADEYKEMVEFAAQVSTGLAALPANPRKAALADESRGLARLIAAKAAPADVAAASGRLRWALVEAYKLRLAPRAAPDVSRGKTLYAAHCGACHGATGQGDGLAAKGLEPAPSNFHDLERMAQRSVYGLYNTITLGVDGTSMASFKHLSEQDRWALAFFVSSMGVPEERVNHGDRLWRAGGARNVLSDLGPVATLSTREMEERHGSDAARVQDYLRAHPGELRRSPIAFAREKIAEAAELQARGDRAAAREAAITAYLEGFELAEASLANVDPGLMREIERAMLELRAAIDGAGFKEKAEALDKLLATAQDKLGREGLAPASAFTASMVILLREGLEAILVLAAIIAFVIKTGRRDALPWIHGGWVAAIVLGAITWILASFVVEISGANRELTEGFTALAAAAMLLYVGYWLHGKSYAEAWNRFIREHVGQALARRTLWAMAAVSFLAVYREMFEIVLFYQALWAQAGAPGRGAVLGGMAAAAAALAAIAFAIFKYSVRLPLGLFFGATSGLLALLAVVFAGHGVAALQEAGVVGMTGLAFDPVPLLGIYPSSEALGAQLLVLCIVALGYWAARRSALTEKPA
jgi:high-affinity iron transporter